MYSLKQFIQVLVLFFGNLVTFLIPPLHTLESNAMVYKKR